MHAHVNPHAWSKISRTYEAGFILQNIIEIYKTSAVRSRISSKFIFASCVEYFDRAYDVFNVTSSKMLVLIKMDKT